MAAGRIRQAGIEALHPSPSTREMAAGRILRAGMEGPAAGEAMRRTGAGPGPTVGRADDAPDRRGGPRDAGERGRCRARPAGLRPSSVRTVPDGSR